MAYATKYIASRIDWCRRESTQVCAPLESAGWRAEAEGLQDALLHRDHTTQYQQGPPIVFERYVLGLADGRAVLRMAAVHQHGSMGSDLRLLGLTRRGKKTKESVWGHGA